VNSELTIASFCSIQGSAHGSGIVLGDPDSATKAFVDLNTELDNEKAAWKAAQTEVDMLAQAVKDMKISADKFTAQIPTHEDMIKYLENRVVDGLNEVRARCNTRFLEEQFCCQHRSTYMLHIDVPCI
jgi:hypothetical protein